jgi:PAS domain S-box-containing protein
VIRDADHGAAAVLHSSREFLPGKPLGLFVAAGFRRAFYERLARQRPPGGSEMFEMRLGRGRQAPAEVIGTLNTDARDARGAPCYRWQLRDVGDTRRFEQALLAERELLESVFGAAQAVIVVLDGEGRILRSNAYLHAVSGYGPDELYRRNWFDILLDPDRRSALRRMVIQAATRGVARSEPVPLLTRAGPRRDVVWSARGLPEGVAGKVVLVGHDVTELQEAQRLALQAERLAAIGQMAAGLAHESRNALQRIQANLSLLALRLRDSPEALDLLDRAQKAEDDLHCLLDDVRSYAAALEPRATDTDLAAVWRQAWADVAPLHGEAAPELCEDPAATDLVCEIDPFQMKRVFRNLFENALAAGADPVRVTVRCRPTTSEGRPALEVRVRDNGPGFAAELRQRLFEPFFTTKTHGTGLGLAICRRIVQAHGGRIEAGEEGPGAELRITLPRRMP